MKIYPLGSPEAFNRPANVRAVATGEFRPPRQGEWYIEPEATVAYLASWDYRTPYYIARLIDTRHVRMDEVHPLGQ